MPTDTTWLRFICWLVSRKFGWTREADSFHYKLPTHLSPSAVAPLVNFFPSGRLSSFVPLFGIYSPKVYLCLWLSRSIRCICSLFPVCSPGSSLHLWRTYVVCTCPILECLNPFHNFLRPWNAWVIRVTLELLSLWPQSSSHLINVINNVDTWLVLWISCK